MKMSISDQLFYDYSVAEKILSGTTIPRFFKVRQAFESAGVDDVYAETMKKLEQSKAGSCLKEGMSICITASSRGIDRQKEILKAIVDYLKSKKCLPFVIPAMGSHGGATAEGQKAVLTEYGITEDYLGCPIKSSMETDSLGFVDDEGQSMDIRIDRCANQADGIVIFGRIKPHSAFRGPYESGLMKMMCIGIGKQEGAESMHADGFGTFKRRIFLYGNYLRTHSKVLFGVSTVENGYDKCNRIDVTMSDDIPEREKELLSIAFSMMPRILVPSADALVVREVGKDYSGSGMDPNITGTWATPYGGGGLEKQRVAVLDVSDASHGNALGIGNADFITKKLFDRIDFMQMYPNSLTNTVTKPVKMPMVLKDDRMAIKAVIKSCNFIDQSNPRVVIINNSLHIGEIWLSEAYWEEAHHIKGMEIASEPFNLMFDEDGSLII